VNVDDGSRRKLELICKRQALHSYLGDGSLYTLELVVVLLLWEWSYSLILYSPVITMRTARFNTHKFCVLITQCIYVFCVDLLTTQRLFPYTALTDWFYNRDGVCLLRGTDWIFVYNFTFGPHSVFVCFVWIWEQTAIISLYSIDWLVFITETECVYCAVRTGSLYIILRSAHTVYLCILCGSENKQRLFPHTTLTDWFL